KDKYTETANSLYMQQTIHQNSEREKHTEPRSVNHQKERERVKENVFRYIKFLADYHFQNDVNANHERRLHRHIRHIHIALKPKRSGRKHIERKRHQCRNIYTVSRME